MGATLGDDLLGELILGGGGVADPVAPLAPGIIEFTHGRGSGTSFTESFEITESGEDHALIVWIGVWGMDVLSVTYGGVALTHHSRRNSIQYYDLWVMYDPPVGTEDIVITCDPLPDFSDELTFGVYNVENAGDITHHDVTFDADPGGLVVSKTIEVQDGALLIDMTMPYFWQGGISITPDGAQTSIYEQEPSTALALYSGASYKTGTAPTTTMSWTYSATQIIWHLNILAIGGFERERPEGDGEVPESVDPAVSTLSATTMPLKFVQIKVGGTDYYFGETQLNDNASWTAAPGKKAGKLANITPVRRELSTRGNYVTSRCSVTLADTDRQFRILASTGALVGSYVALYVVDDATRRAEGEPFRYWAGEIVAHRAESGFRYTLELEDALGRRLSEYSKQPQLPPDKFNTDWFPAINPEADGKPIPIVCGFVSDEDDPSPQGICPATFAGYFLCDGLGVVVDAYIWSQGAFPSDGVWQVFYNDPETPQTRQWVPYEAWGVAVWSPNKPGWGLTGFPTGYVDYLGRRYTPLLVLRDHPLAEAAREGRVMIAGNLYGVAEDAQGGAVRYIDSPVRLWQWLLTNYVWNRYTVEDDYFPLPTLDGVYSIIDTSTVDAVDAVHLARGVPGGYKAGFILGSQDAETVFDVQQRLAEHFDFDYGINRHGQLIVSAEDTDAAATVTFNAQDDIEDGTYEMWTDTEGRINRVEYKWGYRYIPPVAPPATSAEGEPVATKLPAYNEWRSGLVIVEDATAQADVGSVDTYEIEMSMVQSQATANDVAATILARGLGPQGDGPQMVRFSTRAWHKWVEPGDVISVLHPERMGSSSTGTDKVRVLSVEVDPMRDRRTIEGRVIG